MNRIPRPSPSMVIALVALFAAFGGTSYAAAKFGSAQIKNNSIRSVDVKNRSLTGKDVRANALGGAQVDESKLGKVQSAAGTDTATTAGSAANVASAQKAGTANTATNAANANNAANATDATNASSADQATTLGGVAPGNLTQGIVRLAETSDLNSDGVKTIGKNCPAGTKVISGAADLTGGLGQDVVVTDTTPVGDAGWQAEAVEANPTAANWRIRVEVTCADV